MGYTPSIETINEVDSIIEATADGAKICHSTLEVHLLEVGGNGGELCVPIFFEQNEIVPDDVREALVKLLKFGSSRLRMAAESGTSRKH